MKPIILCILFCLGARFLAYGQNAVSIANQTVTPAQTFWVEVSVNNVDPFVALQLDITLPSVLAISLSSVALNPTRINGHDIEASVLTGNILRIICFSIENKPFIGTSGWLFRFQLTAGKVPGDYLLNPQNVVMGNATGANLPVTITPGTIQLATPDISLDQTSIDFGNTAVSQQNSRSLTISNTGNQSLSITSIQNPDNQFALSPAAPFTVGAGGSQLVNITFTPTWKGVFSFELTVNSSDPDQPVTKVQVQARAYTINEIHVGSLSVFSGSYGELTMPVNNMESFAGFQFDLVLPSSMTFLTDSIWFAGRTSNHEIDANQFINNRLRVIGFSPDNTPFSGTSGNLIRIGFHVEGTGGYYGIGIENGIIGDVNGINILSAVYGGSLQIAAPDIDCSTSLDFGEVSSLGSKTLDLTVRNYGNDMLVLMNHDFNNPVFSLLSTLPLEIPIGEERTINVKYLNPDEGSKTGRLRLFSNDPDESPFTISLSGSTYIPNRVYITNQVVNMSSAVFLEVAVRNYEDFVALQLDILYASDTFSLDVDHITATSRLPGHQVMGMQLSAGKIRVLAYSLSQEKGIGVDGPVLRIPVGLLNQQAGQYLFRVENAILGNSKAENILRDAVGGVLTLRAPEITIQKNLNKGWTWFSINVEPQSWAIADVLQSIHPVDGDYIKNQTASSTWYSGYGWFGELTTIDPCEMYKIKLAAVDTLIFEGQPVNPLTNPITINSGWNWIGYLPQLPQPLSSALTSINPVADDYIKNQTSSSTFYDGFGWFGELANMAPLDGYMLKTSHAGTLLYAGGGALKTEDFKTEDFKTEDRRQEDFQTEDKKTLRQKTRRQKTRRL